MGDQPLQGNDAAVMEWVCQGCGTHNADPTMLSHPKLGEDGARCHGPVVAVEYVPLSVAENLATALEEIAAVKNTQVKCHLHGGEIGADDPGQCWCSIVLDADDKARALARAALAEFRAAYPREETT